MCRTRWQGWTWRGGQVQMDTLTVDVPGVLAGRDLVSSVFGNHTTQSPSDGRYNILLLGGDAGADRTAHQHVELLLTLLAALFAPRE